MGRGRKKLAPEIMEASGAYEKNPNRRNKDAPKANGFEPTMPDYFNDEERQKWVELVADLRSMGILSSETRELLIAYCTAYGGWMKARRAVESAGLALVDKENGTIKRNPFCSELHKYRDAMNRLLPEFGLTPSARGNLVSLNDDMEDPFAILAERKASRN